MTGVSEDKSAELNATCCGPVRDEAQGRTEYCQHTCSEEYGGIP